MVVQSPKTSLIVTSDKLSASSLSTTEQETMSEQLGSSTIEQETMTERLSRVIL